MAEPYAPKLHRPATLDHLKKKEPLERTVDIVLNDRSVDAHREAELSLLQAQTALAGLADDAPNRREMEKAVKAAQAELDAAQADLDENTVTMRFRSIGRKAYDALLDAHPPRDEDKKAADEQGVAAGTINWNTETFPQALIAASCVEPQMTAEDIAEIYDSWNTAELAPLFYTALAVNTNNRVGNLGNAFGGTRR